VNLLSRRYVALPAGVLVGLVGGVMAERHTSTAILLVVFIAALVGMAALGDRAFPWAIVLIAVAPWYSLVSSAASAPQVSERLYCSALAAAPLVPWLWSLGYGGSRTRPSRWALLMGILFASLAVLIYEQLGSFSAMIDSQIVGFLFAGVAFLCARHFTDPRGWPAAGFSGLSILAILGADAYASSPGSRVGFFVGYPITYGALLVGLLPVALLFALQRSRVLAIVVGGGSATLMILSQSRSSWVAVTVMMLVVVALLARLGKLRAVVFAGGAALLVIGIILSTGSLNKIIENRLSSKNASSDSVTHREWSYGYATGQFLQRPLLGGGYPGYAALQAADYTGIGAIDNGYLSISVDLGVVGLLAALIPILVALRALARCLRLGVAPPIEVALMLGIIGMAVVTAFYDSFYWAQIDLLLGAMGGALSVRMHTIAKSTQRFGFQSENTRRGIARPLAMPKRTGIASEHPIVTPYPTGISRQ
jgi:hypothetical protein